MTISSNPQSNGILLYITNLVPDPLPDFKGEAPGTRILWACFFGELGLKKVKFDQWGGAYHFHFLL